MTVSWEMLDMRARIRLIDTQIVILLSRRFEIMREVRAHKRKHGIPLVDAGRERDVLAHCVGLGQSLHVPEEIIRSLYEQLFEHVRGHVPDAGLTDIKAPPATPAENGGQAPGSPVISTGRGKSHD